MFTFIIDFVKEGHHYHAPTRLLSGPLCALFEITAAHRQPTLFSVLPTDMPWSPTLCERALLSHRGLSGSRRGNNHSMDTYG